MRRLHMPRRVLAAPDSLVRPQPVSSSRAAAADRSQRRWCRRAHWCRRMRSFPASRCSQAIFRRRYNNIAGYWSAPTIPSLGIQARNRRIEARQKTPARTVGAAAFKCRASQLLPTWWPGLPVVLMDSDAQYHPRLERDSGVGAYPDGIELNCDIVMVNDSRSCRLRRRDHRRPTRTRGQLRHTSCLAGMVSAPDGSPDADAMRRRMATTSDTLPRPFQHGITPVSGDG